MENGACTRYALTGCVLILTACTSIQSTSRSENSLIHGLTYYLPANAITIDVEIAKQGRIEKVELGVSDSYADLSEAYVLEIPDSYLRSENISVAVGANGLLTSIRSETKAGIGDAFVEASKVVANVNALASPSTQGLAAPVCTEGSHSLLIILPSKQGELCGISVSIEPIGTLHTKLNSATFDGSSQRKSGIYYRQYLPYRIVATGVNLTVNGIVYSPTESAVHYLPINKALFAKSVSEVKFDNGVPISYAANTEGEVVSLLKIPADVVSSYFTAVGSLFDSFSSSNQKESKLLASDLELEIQLLKYDACKKAIKSGESELLEYLDC